MIDSLTLNRIFEDVQHIPKTLVIKYNNGCEWDSPPRRSMVS
jgi:hypothetical protein